MQIGIFARTFQRNTLDEVLEAIANSGITEVHFNFACAGLETLPGDLTTRQCEVIRNAFQRHGLSMCGVSGTFNAIHPDVRRRAELVRRACTLIECCSHLGTQLVTLCSGTRHANDMWAHHPDNCESSSWDDLLATLDRLLASAEEHNIVLGIEPEQANVINSAAAARRLLDLVRSPNLKIVLDGVNLLNSDNVMRSAFVVEEAIELLGEAIVCAHAKGISFSKGESFVSTSQILDWEHYLGALSVSGFEGAVVLHNVREDEVCTCRQLLEDMMLRVK